MMRLETKKSWLLAAGFAALAAGCAAQRTRFMPADSIHGGSRKESAVYYQLEASGTKLGDAKVWCSGAYPQGMAGRTHMLHVGLRVRNASQHRFRLDVGQTGVELTTRDGSLVFIDESVRVFGDTDVAPGKLERFELYFPLPATVKLSDIASFEFNWSLKVGEETLITSTVFQTLRRRPMHYASGSSVYMPYPSYDVGER